MTNKEVKNEEAKNGQKAMQKQLSSSFHISKNGPRFFSNQILPGFKKTTKKQPKKQPRKPPKNRNVNLPNVLVSGRSPSADRGREDNTCNVQGGS